MSWYPIAPQSICNDQMKARAIDRKPHLPSQVATLIQREITVGRLKPGDRLPTEHSLAQSFGVSRNVVREAMARLRSDGIIDSRQGIGAFLLPRKASAHFRIDAETLTDLVEFGHLFELRAMLEIRAAGLAAERRLPDAIEDLTAALERMRGAEKWASGGVDADLDFHRALARATGNPYIAQMVAFISDQTRSSILQTQERYGTKSEVIEVTIAEHAAIHKAVLSGSSAEARKAMSRHISSAAARLGVEVRVDHRS